MTKSDMNQVADQLQRDQALVPDQSFIIQAPAGSGKTGLLIQRYLKLLSLVDAPEEIIAITFTRKAAAEMQGRILDALTQAATRHNAETEHDKRTIELATAALKRDEKQAWAIIENPGRLRIQTIDSLCAALTRQMPLLAKLGTQPETLEDADVLYQQAAINTLAELESGEAWSDSIANLLFHLDNDLPRIKNLIVDMLKKRDQWLAYVVQEHDRNDMEQSLANLIEEQLNIVARLIPDNFSNELISLLQFASRHLSETQADNLIVACLDIKTMPVASINALDVWRGISELLLTRTGSWRKQVTVKNGFPAASANKLEAEERSSRKTQMLALIGELQNVEGLQYALTKVSQLPPPTYTDTEWQIVKALCELLKLAAAQLRLVFAERNQMDFIGVAESALNALGTDTEPTDLAMTLDHHIKHVLVDEYQDISVNQYRLLQRLTCEWSMDDGRSLFLVGDPMQSIYRFREAEVGIFIKTFHEQCLGNIPLKALRLRVNFRSQQHVVDWVNKSFATILPEQDDVITGAVSFTRAIAFDKTASGNNVVIYPLYNRTHVKEAEHSVELIQDIKKENSSESIAILVRSRSHLAEIIPALKKAGIDFKAIDIEGLGTQTAIQDLLALTRAYLFPADRVAWLACLRAPWAGLKIESLFKLANKNSEKTIWECINEQSLLDQLDVEDKQRTEKLRTVFTEAFNNRQRSGVRKAIEILWCQLGGPATLSKALDLENCETFFCLLESLDSGGVIEDIQELIEQTRQLYAVPDQASAKQVQIMTIHKAKGLEFDHVILPGLGRTPRSNQADLLVWLLRQGKQQEELVLAPIREAGNYQAAIYDYIHNTDKAKQSYEDARLLYVAATRAKNTLHLIGHARLQERKDEIRCEPQSGSLLAHLWPVVQESYQQYLPIETSQYEEQVNIVINQQTKHLDSNWNLPEPPAAVQWKGLAEFTTQEEFAEKNRIEFEWAGETIKHIGSVVHNAIQHIAEEGVEHWSSERLGAEQENFARSLQQLGVLENECAAAVLRVQQALRNMLEDQRGQWILSDTHKEQYNEYRITGLYKDKLVNVILDRTFVDEDGVRWVIDYKTSPHEGKDKEAFLDLQQQRYQEQLEKYGSLLNQIRDDNIKLGLYFPLLQGWREWEFNK